MKLSNRDYQLICKDVDTDIHELLAYSFNPMLTEIFNKYYDLSRPRKSRVLESWINEYDGARIQVLYHEDDRTFNEIIVDWLFNLRDMYVEHKINLEAFRKYLADIALYTLERDSELFTNISRLLNVLGCQIEYRAPKIRTKRAKRKTPKITLPTILLDSKTEDIVRITVNIINNKGKPVPGIPVKITSIISRGAKQEKYTIEVTTDSKGTVIVPAYKYSTVTIRVGSTSKTITVASKDQTVELVVNNTLIDRLANYVAIILLSSAVIASTLLIIYIAFH